jgi:hypothetical protein
MFFHLNCTEITHLFHEQIVIFEKFTNIRGMDPNGKSKVFGFLLKDLVPCVAGQKVWTLREKANTLISEAEKVV